MYIYFTDNKTKTEYLYRDAVAITKNKSIGTIVNNYLDSVGPFGCFLEPGSYDFESNPYYKELDYILNTLSNDADPFIFYKDFFISQTDDATWEKATLNQLVQKLRFSMNEGLSHESLFQELAYNNSLDWLLFRKIYELCINKKIFCYLHDDVEHGIFPEIFEFYSTVNKSLTIRKHFLPSTNDVLQLLRSPLITPASVYNEIYKTIANELSLEDQQQLDNDLDRIEPVISKALYEAISNPYQDVFIPEDAFTSYWETLAFHTNYLASQYGPELNDLFRILLMTYHPNSDKDHPFWSRLYTKHNLDNFCRKYFNYNQATNLLRKCICNSLVCDPTPNISVYVCNTINELLETAIYICQNNNYTLQKCTFLHPKCNTYFFKKTKQKYCPRCVEKAKQYIDANPKDLTKRAIDNYMKNRNRKIKEIVDKNQFLDITSDNYLEYVNDTLRLLYFCQKPELINGSNEQFKIALCTYQVPLKKKTDLIKNVISTRKRIINVSEKETTMYTWKYDGTTFTTPSQSISWSDLYRHSDISTKNYVMDYFFKLITKYCEENFHRPEKLPASFTSVVDAIKEDDTLEIDWRDCITKFQHLTGTLGNHTIQTHTRRKTLQR